MSSRSNMKNIKMKVDGIMCINCVNKINTVLSGLNGCDCSSVSDDFSSILVGYNKELISEDQIVSAIESIQGKSFRVIEKEEVSE